VPRGRAPHRTAAHLLVALLVLAGAACGDDAETVTDAGPEVTDPADDAPHGAGGGAAGTCLEGTPDCRDTPMGDDEPVMGPDGEPVPADSGDDFPSDAAREEARSMLGKPEAELAADVRVRRRGEESFALTEDYVLGRITVELDDDGTGTYVVTSATVELPDGPETFDA
jgi:hypothetical protein